MFKAKQSIILLTELRLKIPVNNISVMSDPLPEGERREENDRLKGPNPYLNFPQVKQKFILPQNKIWQGHVSENCRTATHV